MEKAASVQYWVVDGVAVLVDPYLPKDPFKNKAIIDPEINGFLSYSMGNSSSSRCLSLPNKPTWIPVAFHLMSILGRLREANGEEAVLVAGEHPITLELALLWQNPLRQCFFRDLFSTVWALLRRRPTAPSGSSSDGAAFWARGGGTAGPPTNRALCGWFLRPPASTGVGWRG